MAATSTRDLVVDLEEVRNRYLPVAVDSGGLAGRGTNEVTTMGLLLSQTSIHWDEAVCVCDLHAAEEGRVSAAASGSMLDGLDRRTPLLAITSEMTNTITKETFALILVHARLPAGLRCVAFPIAIDALDVGSVPRGKPSGHRSLPRRSVTAWCLGSAS